MRRRQLRGIVSDAPALEANAIFGRTHCRDHRLALASVQGRPAFSCALTTKIRALTDVPTAPEVLAEAPGRIRRLSADKGFRRIATRYDELARNYASTVALAAVIALLVLTAHRRSTASKSATDGWRRSASM